jgi:hypothetical protein
MTISQRDLFWSVLKKFQEYKLHEHVLLIGSWVEVVYEESGLLSNYYPSIRTSDLDFLIRKKHPQLKESIEVPKILIDLGFSPNVDSDGDMRFDYYEKDTALYVEFLIASQGSGLESPIKVKELGGISAQALWHLDILQNNGVEVKVNEITVLVPKPSAYILQKMIISDDRKPDKRAKDLAAIQNILETIVNSSEQIEEIKSIYYTFTDKQKSKILDFFQTNSIDSNFLNFG